MRRHIGVVEEGVARFNGQLAAVWHGVPGVDGQVEHRVLDLVRIHQGVPKPPRDCGLKFDFCAQRPAQHVVHAPNKAADVDHLRLQRLSTSEGKQLLGELGAAGYARQGALHTDLRAGVTGYILL